jgi:alpha-glucosidase
MHTFLSSQPQLNGHNPEVQDALLQTMRFWLDRGVDGFRLDALNHLMFDPQFRDNPPAADNGKVRTRPFDFQERRFSQSHPGVVGFIERARNLMDQYGAIFTVAEVGGDNAGEVIAEYTRGNTRLNSAYGFDFLYAAHLSPQFVADTCASWPAGDDGGWPCWAFENHDAPRAISRWATAGFESEWERLKMAILVSLRGNLILYQGEELGLRQVEIPYELLQDPEAIANWPLTLSRDGARTPMPWSEMHAGGFTTGRPWLPVGDENLCRSVEVQQRDPASLLQFTRKALALRAACPALRHGEMEKCEANGALLSIVRRHDGDRVLCQFNFSDMPLPVAEPAGEVLLASDPVRSEVLPAFGFRISRV